MGLGNLRNFFLHYQHDICLPLVVFQDKQYNFKIFCFEIALHYLLRGFGRKMGSIQAIIKHATHAASVA